MNRGDPMLFELSIIPIGSGSHVSGELAAVLKEIESSGLPYRLTPSGTCIEGDWEEVLALVKKCHDVVRGQSSHVMTSLRIEDDADDQGRGSKLIRNIESIEEKVGHHLNK
jgi:uncharacterized protein (TIGR00106 family)